MKVDNVDLSKMAYQKSVSTSNNSSSSTNSSSSANSSSSTDSSPNTELSTSDPAEINNLLRLSSYEKSKLPLTEKAIVSAIEKANKALLGGPREFQFSIHEKTKQIMVKVIDSETHEIIREIPPEKTLDMVAKLWELAGIVVDERR